MKKSSVRIRLVAALFVVLAFTGLRYAAAANADHVAAFKKTHQCPNCDLSNAQLTGIQAPNANLALANLTNANLYGANLTGANLDGAVFDGANLELAILAGAKNASLGAAKTDNRTICPNGKFGPCQ